MKCSFISDIHIRHEKDKGTKILKAFLSNPKTQQSDKVFFLGDIFDALCGNHAQFIQDYPTFFKGINHLLESGKEVIFVEGNHDFHFKQIFENYTSKEQGQCRYLTSGEEIIIDSKRFYFCHGYEVDYFNKYFKRWHRIYTSNTFNFFVSKILTHNLIKKIGVWAAKDSKKRGKRTFDFEKMQEIYLSGAKELLKERNLDGVIAGHTHISAFHTFDDGSQYFNCGFPQKDNHFIHFSGNKFEQVTLL